MAHIVKITAKLILALIAAILGAISFLIGLIIKVRSAMRLWQGFRSRLASARAKAA